MGQKTMQPGACRMCGQVGVALAPFRYGYLCLSRFGASTQVTMLMLAYNPTLPEEVVQRNSLICRTVYPDPQDETVGTVLLARGKVPVFVVEGTQSKNWATSLSDARYLAHARVRGSERRR